MTIRNESLAARAVITSEFENTQDNKNMTYIFDTTILFGDRTVINIPIDLACEGAARYALYQYLSDVN